MAVTLICVDVGQNHQKFWTGEVLANGDLKVVWGRVGTKGQEKVHPIRNPIVKRQLHWPSDNYIVQHQDQFLD